MRILSLIARREETIMSKPILDRRTVLLVSDDAATASELAQALHGSGASVRVAASERAALAVLYGEPIDALVCDLAIRFDAYAWMKRVRSTLDPEKRVVAAIAWSGDQSFLHLTPFRAAGAGFDVHLLTRSPHDTLVEYVKRLTDQEPRRSTRPPPPRTLP